MVGTDETMELWRPPNFHAVLFAVYYSKLYYIRTAYSKYYSIVKSRPMSKRKLPTIAKADFTIKMQDSDPLLKNSPTIWVKKCSHML